MAVKPKYKVGQKIKVVRTYSASILSDDRDVERYLGDVFTVKDITYGGAPEMAIYWRGNNTRGFWEDQVELAYDLSCFCHEDQEFLPSCFDCIPRLMP